MVACSIMAPWQNSNAHLGGRIEDWGQTELSPFTRLRDLVNRQITRSVHEHARDEVRQIARTEQYRQSRKDRKKVEMLFAHLKRILKLDRLRLRGLSGASDEFTLAATVQNLRRMAKWLMPIPRTVNPTPV